MVRDSSGACLVARTCPTGYVVSGLNRCDPKNVGAPSSCPVPGGVGNPIHAGTGNQYRVENDYQGTGPFPLRFSRSYNSSGSSVKGRALGSVWRHSYERSVSAYTSPNATYAAVARPDGKAYFFTLVGRAWTPDSDVGDALVRVTDAAGNATGWRYTNSNDETETYDAAGKLVSIVDRAGLRQSLTYSDAKTPAAIAPIPGLLIRVTDAFGRQLNFTYDGTQRLTALTDPAGGLYAYGYDADGNLASVTRPDSQVRTYRYNEPAYTSNTHQPHALTGIVDENGSRFASFNYDSQGRAISSERAGGTEKISLAYGPDGTTTVTDALGTARTYHFQNILGVVKTASVSQPYAGCGSAARNLGYDAHGNVAGTTDYNGNKICYAYDLSRNLETARIEGIAPSGSCPADPLIHTPAANTLERKIVTIWHSKYRLPTQINEPGRLTTFVYNPNGTLQARAVTDTVLHNSRSWNYTYDANGQLKTVDGPRTDVTDLTTYAYYPDTSDSHTLGDLQTVTDALGHVTLFTQYDKHGRPLSLTDPNGLVAKLTYDALGRLTARTLGGNTTTFAYYPTGLLQTLALPDLSTYTYTYDAAHRLTKIVDNLGNEVDYTLDNVGNVTQQTIKNPDGSVTKTESAVFDGLSRLQQTLGAQNQTTQFGYDANGNLTTVVDPKHHPATTAIYDALNRVRQVQDAAAGITQYAYDALDQLNQVTAPNGASTRYTVDALGNRLTESGPDRGTLQASYDEAGNRKTLTDARGITASYRYDALNRLILVSYPAAGENIAYTYDTGTGCSNGIGRLCQVEDGAGATRFAYDSQGNLTRQTRTEAGQSYTTSYAYDSVNRISQITGPDNRTVNYGRDAAGRIDSVAAPVNGVATALVRQISRNALGLVARQTFANGYSESRDYDGDGQAISASQTLSPNTCGGDSTQVPLPIWALTVLILGLALLDALRRRRRGRRRGKYFAALLVGGAGLLIAGLLYSPASYEPVALRYDADGNLEQRIDGNGTTRYGYDALDRLNHEAGPIKSQTFGYDSNGNRTGDGGGSYAYPPNGNRLQTAHGQAIATDPAGNLTGDGVYTYVYNQAGQLARVLKGASTVASYAYDYQGRRTRKQLGTAVTLYHYDPAGHLIAESNGAGAILRTYIWRDNTPLIQIEQSSGTDRLYYLETDTLGTPRTARDETGSIVWLWNSDAFGTTSPNEDPDGNGIATRINLRFPGQYYDEETGLHYNMARYYDPATGRYLQSDPGGLAGGVNTYAYADGNPLSCTDPSGLSEIALNGLDGTGPSCAGTITVTGNNGRSVTVPASSSPNPTYLPGIADGTYPGTFDRPGLQDRTNGVRINNGGRVTTIGPHPAQGNRYCRPAGEAEVP